MKMKDLFFGMLAFLGLAFVGCSDDTIEGANTDGKENLTEETGYFAVSFSSSTDSSRGVTDNANGDKHGTTDDSEHYNGGKEGESKVNSILVVLKGTKNEHYAYFNSGDLIGSAFSKEANDNYYMMKEAMQVKLDTYKVLVVVNPTAEMTTDLTSITDKQISGENELGTTTSLYETILNKEITGDDLNKAVAKVIATSTAADNTKATENPTTENANFMMANREEVANIVVDESNDASNPAEAEVEVERVVSKITFRPGSSSLTEEDKTNIKAITGKSELTENQLAYWYKVPFKQYEKEQVTETIGEGDDAVVYAKYSYKDSENEEQFVYQSLSDSKWYTISEGTATGITLDENVTPIAVGRYKTDESGNLVVSTQETWYVELTDYALLNLSKSVYAVRHIGTNDYSDENTIKEMGKLGNSYPYLVDPKSTTKNAVDLTAEWNTTSAAEWFFNPWHTVAEETEKTSGWTIFQSFGSENQGEADSDHDGTSDVGNLLSYCFENAVKADHQILGLSTGIVFKSRMYAPTTTDGTTTWGTPTEPLFSYKGVAYKNVKVLSELNPDLTIDAKYLATDYTWDAAGIIAFEKAYIDVSVYRGNTCYYYTSQIKHFDNGDNTTPGIMEFAIMRNNIYSLSVTAIEQIGDATLNVLDPKTPDEEKNANIKVHARILPWIVRFTDINF